MDRPLAVIDIGTNTVRLLIAQPGPGPTLVRRVDESITVRLGQGVDRTGRLAPERMEHAARVIDEFTRRARAAGVAAVLAIATSAVRDAANRDEFAAMIGQRSDLVIEVIGGEREAALTFRGAMLGRTVAHRQLVADVGGGSTEVIVAHDGALIVAASLQLGSGRLTERCLPGDPPAAEEVAAARRAAREALADFPAVDVDAAVLVGGTASALQRLTPRAPDDDRLSRSQLADVLRRLLGQPAATTAADGSVDVNRARVLPGGILAIEALMERFRLEALVIGQGSIREGALLDWLARHDGGEDR